MLEYKRIYARVHCPACEGFKDCKTAGGPEYIPLKFHYTEPAREADLYCPDFEPKGVTTK